MTHRPLGWGRLLDLPAGQELPVKIAVAIDYQVSYLSEAQQGKKGLHWRREVDLDNLVVPDNLSIITFKTRELISSGKTLEHLASESQFAITLKSNYVAVHQQLILSHAEEGLSVGPKDYHANQRVQVSCIAYFSSKFVIVPIFATLSLPLSEVVH